MMASMGMTQESSAASNATHEADAVLLAKLDDVRLLVSVLKAIHFVDSVMCTITESGIKFTVQEASTVQARVFIQKELFREYRFSTASSGGEVCELRVKFSVLLECLSVFGASDQCALKIRYDGYGEPLVLMLEEQGVITDCSIKTLELEDLLDIDIRAAEIPSNIIMKSQWLADVFSEFDSGIDEIEYLITPSSPFFRLTTRGPAGTLQVDCPKDSDVVESFTCTQAICNRYKLKLLKPSEKALVLSEKFSVRMNVLGVLSVQFLVPTRTSSAVFIEYLCLPQDEEDEDEDDVPMTAT